MSNQALPSVLDFNSPWLHIYTELFIMCFGCQMVYYFASFYREIRYQDELLSSWVGGGMSMRFML